MLLLTFQFSVRVRAITDIFNDLVVFYECNVKFREETLAIPEFGKETLLFQPEDNKIMK